MNGGDEVQHMRGSIPDGRASQTLRQVTNTVLQVQVHTSRKHTGDITTLILPPVADVKPALVLDRLN